MRTPTSKLVHASSYITPFPVFLSVLQTKELGKNVCGKDGSYPALKKEEAALFKKNIDQKYRINMVLDNLPVTVYDLENDVSWGLVGTQLVGAVVPGRRLHPPACLNPRHDTHDTTHTTRTQNEMIRPGFELG